MEGWAEQQGNWSNVTYENKVFSALWQVVYGYVTLQSLKKTTETTEVWLFRSGNKNLKLLRINEKESTTQTGKYFPLCTGWTSDESKWAESW